MSKPTVLILVDVQGWAWSWKADQLKRYLSNEFEITIHVQRSDGIVPPGFDLYHTFGFPQMDRIPPGERCVTGITAHILSTLTEARVQAWADQAVAIHANSVLLCKEFRRFHDRLYYLPNGVDPERFYRMRQRPKGDRLIVGHVGKLNPRKGADIIAKACDLAGAEFRMLQHGHQDAIPPEGVREFYQDLHVLAVASDFDGTPNPMLEAAACGVAIVGNRIGNLPEFVSHMRNGMIVDRTTDSLAEAFDHLSVLMAAQMGEDARVSILKGWTWKTQAENYRRMWRECL